MPTGAILDAGFFLFGLGTILYIGVIASSVFEHFKIPDVLILILLGLVLGPILNLISPSLLTPWMPIVGAIALSLILFEGGLDLDFDSIVQGLSKALYLALGSFILTMAVIAWLYHASTGADWTLSLLLGSTLGCVSTAVIFPIASKLNLPQNIKTQINLEAAFSDMFGVVVTLVLIRLAAGPGFQAGHIFNSIVGAFTIAIIGGVFFGIFWLWALEQLKQSPFSYMMTLAAIFVLYGLTEILHGSGPMAVLTFGIVLPNADSIAKLIKKNFKFELNDKIRQFNTEGAFFVRTFFFVYLGLVVSFNKFGLKFILVVFGILSAIILSRYIIIKILIPKPVKDEIDYTVTYLAMIPRGLTSAVLVGMVQSKVAGTSEFLEYAFVTILVTNVIMTIWIFQNERTLENGSANKK